VTARSRGSEPATGVVGGPDELAGPELDFAAGNVPRELAEPQDELDLTPPPGQGRFQPPKTEQLVSAHDEHIAKGRASLSNTNDEYLLTTKWNLKAGGQVVLSDPRHIVLRDTLNHLAHHRGQLTVYLRLLNQPVPAVYGPSADDQRFL